MSVTVGKLWAICGHTRRYTGARTTDGRHGSSGSPTRTRYTSVRQKTHASRGQHTVRAATEQDSLRLTNQERLDCRLMADSESTAPEVTELAEGLHRALSKLFSILRRGDPN